MGEAYKIEGDTIVINRELNELDLFVKDFLDMFKKFTNYLLVSGYVSITSGRSRATEDVDILFLVLDKSKFNELFNYLIKNGFWCYQGDTAEDVYTYIKSMDSIRFARNGEVFPNMECIPVNSSKKAQFFELNNSQRVKVKDFEFLIPPIEFEILYKEIRLKSEKDIEDARHLRNVFAEILSEEKFNKYKHIIGDKNE